MHKNFHSKIGTGITSEIEKCPIENSKLINKFRNLVFYKCLHFFLNSCLQSFSLNNTSINMQFNLVIKSDHKQNLVLQVTNRFHMQNYKYQI